MSSLEDKVKPMPFYVDIDGFRIPGVFSADAYRSAINYKPCPDDFFIVTFPKCGTTWVQTIVCGIYNKGKPFESALDFFNRTPFLEMTGADGAIKMKRPGAIKLHLPFRLTPYSPEAKYLFIGRNPKDCCVSFFYHTRNGPAYQYQDGKFNDYFELFIDGQTDFGDYFDTLLSWYEHRNDPNVLFITYEDLKKDTETMILKIAEFMGQEYKEMLESDPEMMSLVIQHSSMDFMKEFMNKCFSEMAKMPKEFIANHPDVPQGLKDIFLNNSDKVIFAEDFSKVDFIRKGIIGDWRNHFSEEQNARLEKKYIEKTKGTDIPKLWKDCMGMAEDSDT